MKVLGFWASGHFPTFLEKTIRNPETLCRPLSFAKSELTAHMTAASETKTLCLDSSEVEGLRALGLLVLGLQDHGQIRGIAELAIRALGL